MAAVSTARTEWAGDLTSGSGTTALASGVGTFAVNWKARAEGSDATTSPEELLAAAHASCFAMAMSHELTQQGTPPTDVTTDARVTFQAGEGITGIELAVEARVAGITAEEFSELAIKVKGACPVSVALRNVPIELVEATLLP